jgi:hypothetical protein
MYFDDSEEPEDESSPTDELDVPELLLRPRGSPGNRDELIAQLPEKHVADRLIMRYFSSMSPSQRESQPSFSHQVNSVVNVQVTDIIHRPTFTKKVNGYTSTWSRLTALTTSQYAHFWQDPNSVSLHWLAQLFMMLAQGTLFNEFAAPHELAADSPIPATDLIKHYRSCTAWALIWGKYTAPTTDTLPAFVLYVESCFILSRAAQMNCYVLSGVCVRLLLKMGLHRDPSKLANISPYEGEMRRRIWNMATQIELLVSFHMGLPSMLAGIESDTQLPSNLYDDDFDEYSTSLPPGRPPTDYTHMTYAINKSKILRVFNLIAQQAHALSPPEYNDVLKLDAALQDVRNSVPDFMRVRPLEQCVGDSPIILIQRFGLAAIYNKCRCVLHRRYLAQPIPNKDHNYSRQQAIDAALLLLEYQLTIWQASKPGNVLSSSAWFLSSLAVHDFLLAAMIVYLLIRNEDYPDGEAFNFEGRMPSKEELKKILKDSHTIWTELGVRVGELKKTADTLGSMLNKLGEPVDMTGSVAERANLLSVEDSEYYQSSGSVEMASSTGRSASGATGSDARSSLEREGERERN